VWWGWGGVWWGGGPAGIVLTFLCVDQRAQPRTWRLPVSAALQARLVLPTDPASPAALPTWTGHSGLWRVEMGSLWKVPEAKLINLNGGLATHVASMHELRGAWRGDSAAAGVERSHTVGC